MRFSTTFVLAPALLLLASCAPNADMNATYQDDGPLIAALQLDVENGSARFSLRVTNTSDDPIEVHFNTGQTHDFVVHREDVELWRWSEDMMFTQALLSMTVDPGETLRFEERWTPDEVPSGPLLATGVLTSASHPLEQETWFDFR